MPISPLSTPPTRKEPSTFAERTDTLLGKLPGFVTEANALEANVNAKEASAVSSADIAVANATAAQAMVNAVKWISGTTYAVGDPVWSPATLSTYRRKVAGGGTVDPSLDLTNWVVVAVYSGRGDLANITIGII